MDDAWTEATFLAAVANGDRIDLDGYELHLRNLLNREFGGDSAPFIEIVLHPIGDKHVCEVKVTPGRHAYMLVEPDKGRVRSAALRRELVDGTT